MLPAPLRVAVRSLVACVLALCALTGARGPAAQGGGDLRKAFEELDAKKDDAGLREFWKQNADATLGLIDSYLEGSLREIEKKGDAKKIAQMQQLALRGAKAADAAHGREIFTDYASSFIGWDEAQRKSFRAGQKAFGKAGAALKQGDAAAALAAAEECVALARPLGDWWGTAMGLTASAEAQEKLGKTEAAADLHAQAWLIHRELGLRGDAYGNLASMARLYADLGRTERARVSAERALEMARALGDAEGTAKLEELVKRLAK
jgi:tetratricopeptide (TPR) repeat protein